MTHPNKKTKTRSALSLEPWTYVDRSGKAQIEAFIIASGRREIIAETFPTAGNTAEAVADLIIRAVNNIEKREHLINEMEAALEICLECEGLDWSAEHDADIAVRHAKLRPPF